MPKLNQQGVVHVLALVVLVAGLAAGLYLVNSKNSLKLFSRAAVSSPISLKADLIPIDLQAPSTAKPGQIIPVIMTVKNQGGKDAVSVATTSAYEDRVFLSTDQTYNSADTYLGKFKQTNVVVAGSSYTATINAPLSGKVSGNYYLILRVDNWNDVSESDNNNNQKVVPLAISASAALPLTPDASSFKNALYYDSNRQSPSLVVLGSNRIGSFNGLTMEAWVKLKENTKVSDGYPIIYKKVIGGASGDTFAYLLSITKDKKLKFTYSVLYQGRWAPVEITSSSTINPDQWTHVAVLYYTGEQKCMTGQCKSDEMLNKVGLYINGQQVAVKQQTGTIGGGNNNGAVMIGSDGYGYFNGVVDDVRISNGIQYIGPSFSVPLVPSAINPPPLGGISTAAGVLLLCHFDESAGNPVCNSGDGTAFQTVATNLIFVTYCTVSGCEIIPATPTPSPSPTPSKQVNSSITTPNRSWPTYVSGNIKAGDLRIEYSANQFFNIRYWLEFPDCPNIVSYVSPGYYTYTRVTTSFAQNFSVNLVNTSSAKTCTFTLRGTDTMGAYVPDASVIVTINP